MVKFDILIRDLFDFKGDPYPLRIGTERVGIKDEVGRLGVTAGGRSG